MKIAFVHLAVCIVGLTLGLVGCNLPEVKSTGIVVDAQYTDLIDGNIPPIKYGEQAKVIVEWMHKNEYGLTLSEKDVRTLYVGHIPGKRQKQLHREYFFTHRDLLLIKARQPNQLDKFERATRGDITLKVHQTYLTIRINGVGQARLPIDVLNEIAAVKPKQKVRIIPFIVVNDLTMGRTWTQILPTPTAMKGVQSESKAVVEWVEENNYQVVKDDTYSKYFIDTGDADLGGPFYIGEPMGVIDDLEFSKGFHPNPPQGTQIIYHVPISVLNDIEIIDKVEIGDFTLQVEGSVYIFRVKDVGEMIIPIETPRVGRGIRDAKLFQLIQNPRF